MSAIDITKLEVAIKYIERMAEGSNPVNNQPLEDDAVLNNPNVVRCLYFVTDVLKAVRANDGVIGRKRKKEQEPFPFEILSEFRYRSDTSISHLMQQINEPIEDKDIKKISYNSVTKGLKLLGYLEEKYNDELKKNITMPTPRGEAIGLYCEKRTPTNGRTYFIVMYNEQAQYFIVNNLCNIINGEEPLENLPTTPILQ